MYIGIYNNINCNTDKTFIIKHKNIFDYIKNDNLDAFNDLYVEDSGYYAGSPITWFSEFIRPFTNPTRYLFPNRQIAIVDSGISYVFLNLVKIF